jgi:hypothetical protein
VSEQSDHDLLIRVEEGLAALKEAMEQRFDQLTSSLADRDRTVDDRHSDHESRIRSLERRVWALPSLATVFGALGLVVSAYSLFNQN